MRENMMTEKPILEYGIKAFNEEEMYLYYKDFKNNNYDNLVMKKTKEVIKKYSDIVLYKDYMCPSFEDFIRILFEYEPFFEYIKAIEKELINIFKPSNELEEKFIKDCIISQTVLKAFEGDIKEKYIQNLLNGFLGLNWAVGKGYVATLPSIEEDVKNKVDLYIVRLADKKRISIQIKSKSYFNYSELQNDQQKAINILNNTNDTYFIFYDDYDQKLLSIDETVLIAPSTVQNYYNKNLIKEQKGFEFGIPFEPKEELKNISVLGAEIAKKFEELPIL